jgi:hypothetical protein
VLTLTPITPIGRRSRDDLTSARSVNPPSGFTWLSAIAAPTQPPFVLKPAPTAAFEHQAQGLSSGVIQVVLADGSVRGLNSSVTPLTWFWAMTPNGGEVLGNNW